MLDREQPCNQDEIHHEDSYLRAQAIVTQVAEAIHRGPVWPAVGLCRSLGAAIGGALVEVGSGYQGADEEVRDEVAPQYDSPSAIFDRFLAMQRLSQEPDGEARDSTDDTLIDDTLDETIDAAARILETVSRAVDEPLSDAVVCVQALGREAAEMRMNRIRAAELNKDYTILNGLELLANMSVVHPEASGELLRLIAFDTWERDGKVSHVELIHLAQQLAGTQHQIPSDELMWVNIIRSYARQYASELAN